MPARPMEPNSFHPVLPPLSPAMSVCAAASPMGYSSSASSMKWRRRSTVHTRPRMTPDSATSSISYQPTSSAYPSIQMPGMVNAKPPATMAPALMTVCVTLASLRLALPCPRALRKNSEMMAANTMGQGSAPILRAVYTDAAVMMAQPTQPMMMPRSVSCPLSVSMSSPFRISASPRSGSRVTERTSTVYWTKTAENIAKFA